MRALAAGRALVLAAGIAFAGAASATGVGAAMAVQTGFLDRAIVVDGTEYRYQVYVPADYTPARSWPVLLFLHGSGERGDDGLRQTQVGLPAAIRNDRSRFPMVVVMPQARAGTRWPGAMATQAMAALDAASAEFHGDPDRTYLTGMSMGGQGAWLLAAAHPHRFAAVATVCGFLRVKREGESPDPDLVNSALLATVPGAAADPEAAVARRIGSLPVWIFHGARDDVVPVENSRRMHAALQARGGEVRYSEYPEANHNAWDRAYGEPGLVPWLLSHRRGEPAATGAR